MAGGFFILAQVLGTDELDEIQQRINEQEIENG
jgi:hypothetical protein